MYVRYEKVPWELGYKHYEEIDALMPLFNKELLRLRDKQAKNQDAANDFEKIKSEHRKGRRGY